MLVVAAARRVAESVTVGYAMRLGDQRFVADLLALRFAVRALEGGGGRRLRDEDSGDMCQCPEHRYQD